ERSVGTGRLHLPEVLLVEAHGVAATGGDARVGEHDVDAVAPVDPVGDLQGVPPDAGRILGVEDPVAQVLPEDAVDVVRAGDVVVVRVREGGNHVATLQVDRGRAGRTRPRQHS